MNPLTEMTNSARLAAIEAEAAALKAQIAAENAKVRPEALVQVLDAIRAHGFTRSDLDPALRKRAFSPKPRKPQAAANGQAEQKAQVTNSTGAQNPPAAGRALGDDWTSHP